MTEARAGRAEADEALRACVRTRIYEFSPAGTAEGYPGLRRGLFSAVPAGLGRALESNPGLASWAKFSRPCGTEFGNRVLTHAL